MIRSVHSVGNAVHNIGNLAEGLYTVVRYAPKQAYRTYRMMPPAARSDLNRALRGKVGLSDAMRDIESFGVKEETTPIITVDSKPPPSDTGKIVMLGAIAVIGLVAYTAMQKKKSNRG